MLRTLPSRLLRPQIRSCLHPPPLITAVRTVRTRRSTALSRTSRETRGEGAPSTTTDTPSLVTTDLDTAMEEMVSKNGVEVEASPDLILLEHMNISRPGTKTDKRYKRQKKLMLSLKTETEKTQSLVQFLLVEAERELFNYPNPDELEPDEDAVKSNDLEKGIEYEMKLEAMTNWSVGNQRYKRFDILLSILERLMTSQDYLSVVSLETLAHIFEISQYVDDHGLKQKARLISGKMIYGSKKVEFDPVNESFYISALMEFDEHTEAQRLLEKRAEKVNQRWWYELIVVSHLETLRFDKAEETAELIREKFGEYLDSRIYLKFVESYLNVRNYEKAEKWTSNFQQQITTMGFMTGKRREPGLGATEEATLEYLNREDAPTKEDFLNLISMYLNSDAEPGIAAHLIEFYMAQPEASPEDVALKLLDFKLHYQSKIKPLLKKMSDRTAVEFLSSVVDQVREMTPIQSTQGDMMDELLLDLGGVGGVDTIIQEMKQITQSQQKLSDKHFYTLITALLRSGREGQAFKVLENLEISLAKALDAPEEIDGFVIPPVNTYHYLPFVRYYGRTQKIAKVRKIVKRFEEKCGIYNAALLTQLISTYTKSRYYHEVINVIRSVVVDDIHKQFDEGDDFTRLYSTMWVALKDLATARRSYKNIDRSPDYPDYRVVFLKMIEDEVVPSPDDYTMIVRAFLVNKDFYPLPCVLQYMGKIHQCTPTPQLLRAIERLYRHKQQLGKLKPREVSETYTEKLNAIHQKRQEQRTLDPFAPQREVEDEEKIIRELQRTQETSTDADLLWRVALANVLDILESINADENEMRLIHEQFGLVYDPDQVFAPE